MALHVNNHVSIPFLRDFAEVVSNDLPQIFGYMSWYFVTDP
jgi:hypothetical protein